MMDTPGYALAGLALGALALIMSRPSDLVASDAGELGVPAGETLTPAPGLLEYLSGGTDSLIRTAEDTADTLTGGALGGSARWQVAAQLPENYAYVAALRESEAAAGAPAYLFVRQCWEESRFKPNAYNVGSGATGIMQIVPRWHPNVNAWDAYASIVYAGQFMAQLFAQFGTWELALKAYNWGPANVKNWLAGKATQPAETEKYSRLILADLAAAGVIV